MGVIADEDQMEKLLSAQTSDSEQSGDESSPAADGELVTLTCNTCSDNTMQQTVLSLLPYITSV